MIDYLSYQGASNDKQRTHSDDNEGKLPTIRKSHHKPYNHGRYGLNEQANLMTNTIIHFVQISTGSNKDI